MKRAVSWLPVLLVTAMLLLSASGLHACEGCRMIDDKSPAYLQRAGAGFSVSVLFMIAAPMAIVAFLIRYIVQTVKKLDQNNS